TPLQASLESMYRAITGFELTMEQLAMATFIIEQLPRIEGIDQTHYEELQRRTLLALIAA
ncbi:MAG: hypothetical protein V2A72_07520, partial [Candidatus Omnitrophota bacterium]